MKKKRKSRGTRVVYKNVKNKFGRNLAMRQLRKKGLNPAFTDGGTFSKSKKGTDVYASARKQTLKGFKVKKQKMTYI